MSQPLLSALDEVSQRVALARHVLICIDFDGTLTPLADHPNDVYLSKETRQSLAALAGRHGCTLAIISGRAEADLQTRVGLPGVICAGNHGLEIKGPDFSFVDPAAATQVDVMHKLAAELTSRLAVVPGALVEDKGLTLSVHYRQVAAEAVEEVRRTVHGVLATSNHPFQLTTGCKVFEIRPRVDWNKGSAVCWIRDHLNGTGVLVIYLGDDSTDEDAFAALTDGITVRVCPAPETAAHYLLDSPAEVQTFLKWLAGLAEPSVIVG